MGSTAAVEDGGESGELRCRICLETDVNEMISMFCVASTQKKLLAHMTLAVAGVPISMCDKMPQVICDKCLGNLDVAYGCWRRCRESWGDYVRDPALQDKEEDFRCRICLSSNVEELISLYCICDSQLLKINEMVKQYAGVDVRPDDGHPQYTCDGCLGELNTGFEFRKLCRQSNVTLRCELQTKEVANGVRAPIESDNESLPEAERDNETTTTTTLEPLKKIAKRRQSVKMKAKPELPADTVKITRMDVPEVVPGRFKKSKKYSSKVDLISLETAKLDVPKVVSNSFKKNKKDVPEVVCDNLEEVNSHVPEVVPVSNSFKKNKKHVPEVVTDNMKKTNSHVPEVVPGSFKKKKKITSEVVPNSSKNTMLDVPEVAKKKVFSSPSEFKQLANQILNKPSPAKELVARKTSNSELTKKKNISSPDKTLETSVPSATLVAFEIRVITDSEHYTHSEVSSFKCSRCNARNQLKTIENTCVKCACAFDNYSLVKPFKGASGMTAYCCTECNYFAKTLSTMVNHLGEHLPVVPVGKTKPLVMKNLVVPIVPIAMKEETVEVSDNEEEPVPDPLETVFVPGTLKRVNDAAPEPDVQNKKPRKSPSADTMDVLIELNQSEPESSSDVELITSLKAEPDTVGLFDTLLETILFKILFLNGALCCGCLKLFPSSDDLHQHLTRDHAINGLNPNEITCGTCNSRCGTVRDVHHHQLLATKKIFYFCKLCPQLLIADPDFEGHRAEDHPSAKVHLLPRTELLVTKVEAARTSEPSPVPVKLSSGSPAIFKALKETAHYRLLLLQGELCCYCKLVHPTRQSLDAHLVADHFVMPSNVRYKCESCQENCRTETKLARHRLAATRRLYYACKLCRGQLLYGDDDFEAHRAKSHPQLEVEANGLPSEQQKLLVETTKATPLTTTTTIISSSSSSDG